MTLTGYDSSNAQVASTVFMASINAFLETTLSLSSVGNDIVKFQITSTNVSNGFDNIRFTAVPEPAGISGVAIGGIAATLRRRR